MISMLLLKIGASLLVVLVALLVIDSPNAAGESSAWVYIPGAIAGMGFGVCILIGLILMIWGL